MSSVLTSPVKKEKKKLIILTRPLNMINEVKEEKEDDVLGNVVRTNVKLFQPCFSTLYSTKGFSQSVKNLVLPSVKKRLLKNEDDDNNNSPMNKYFEGLSNEFSPKQKIKMKGELSLNFQTAASSYKNTFLTESSNNNSLSKNDAKAKRIIFTENKLAISPNKRTIEEFSPTDCKKTNQQWRIRTYQPHININWKSDLGLRHCLSKGNTALVNNIDDQYKPIDEQVRLLLDNINHYKTKIVPSKLFIKAFSCMKYKSKIIYNKTLEELCGILLLLPQLLLLEFYRLVEKFNHSLLPKQAKLIDKCINEENDCLNFNLHRLDELTKFFKKCFDVYLSLFKEIDSMILKKKKYNDLICILEKARYDISSLIKTSENSILIYQSDLDLIEKYNSSEDKKANNRTKNLHIISNNNRNNKDSDSEEEVNDQNKQRGKQFNKTQYSKNKVQTTRNSPKTRMTVIDKIRNDLLFKRNGEKERKYRIAEVLRASKDCLSDGDSQDCKPVNTKKKIRSLIVSQ